MNSEPGGESMENTRLLHTKMKLTLYFLGNETAVLLAVKVFHGMVQTHTSINKSTHSTSRSFTCRVYMSRSITSQGTVRQSLGSMRWLNLGLAKNSCCARGLQKWNVNQIKLPPQIISCMTRGKVQIKFMPTLDDYDKESEVKLKSMGFCKCTP